MTILQRVAILCFFLTAGMSGAQAQQVIGLTPGASFSLYGLTFTVGACTIGFNGGGTAACTAGNKVELLQLIGPTHTIDFEVIGYTSATPSTTATSAALKATGSFTGSSHLNFTLLVTPKVGFPTNTTKVDDASLTSNYNNYWTSCRTCSNESAASSAAFSAGATATTLNPTLIKETSTTGGAPHDLTTNAGPNGFTTASSGFTITENLTLTDAGNTAGLVQFNSVVLKLHAAPEPASIGVLLLGLGGLAVARRRLAS